MRAGRLVVAIPVKDEAERLGACLAALAHQTSTIALDFVVLINNSTDDSARIARHFAAASERCWVEEVKLPPAEAHAGGARRLAMARAAARAGAGGVVLTTDADGCVAPDWLSANLAALNNGADAVAGRAVIDPVDEAAIPLALREADARECRYAALLNELAAVIDPAPSDPWPRHDEHSGASIAVTVAAFRRAGGIPDLAVGEDRAFFRALRRVDARIRHAPNVRVVVSGRVEGRAKGGMADTIRRRLVCPDLFLDDRLEGAHAVVLRARLRRRARLVWSDPDDRSVLALARDLLIMPAGVREFLTTPHFGAAWEALEEASPALRRQPVPAAAVMSETAIAANILAELRPQTDADQSESPTARSTSSR